MSGGTTPVAKARKNVTFNSADVGEAQHEGSLSNSRPETAIMSPRASQQQQQQQPHGSHRTPYPPPAPFFLTKDDVVSAFEFFDVGGSGLLTGATLKARLSAFYPDLTSREYRFLLEDPSPGMTAVKRSAAATSTNGGSGGTTTSHTASGGAEAAVASHAAPSRSATANGLDVDQLWDIIDTFQRQYMSSSSSTTTTTTTGAAGGGRGAQNSTGTYNNSTNNNNVNSSGSSKELAEGSGHTLPGTHESMAGAPPANSSFASRHAVAPGGSWSAADAVDVGLSAELMQRFDPVREAFQVYDPHHTNAVDVEVLGRIMSRIGFGELSEDELALLVRTADFDEDGKIDLEDFRRLVGMKGRFQKKT